MVNKHNVMFEYMQQCPQVKDLFFNFSENKNGGTVLSPISSEYVVETYIDGTTLRWYDFTVMQYLNVSVEPNSVENINTVFEAEKVMEWINAQDAAKNYPDFGDHCSIIGLSVLQNTPTITGQNLRAAKFMFSCRVEYHERK